MGIADVLNVQQSKDDATMAINDPLGERRQEKEIIGLYYENFDEVMTSGEESERPWETPVTTQPQDVTTWIKDPRKIAAIQPNLEDFVHICRALTRPIRVLDVGCNGGYLYDYLTKSIFENADGFVYHGIDIYKEVAAAAAKEHEDASNATFEQGDIYTLVDTFGENSFDVVFCSRVLLHIPYFEKALMNLYLVSKTLTFLVLVVDDRDYVKKARIIDVDNGTSGYWFFRYFSRHFLDKVINGMYAYYRIISGSGRYDSVVVFKGGRNL